MINKFKKNTRLNDYHLFHFRILSSQKRDFTAGNLHAGETQEGEQIFPDNDAVSSTTF